MENKTIRWRAEHEKTGYEHWTPMTAEALAVLEEARRNNPGIGTFRCCRAEGSIGVYEPFPGPYLVEQGRGASRARAKRGRGWHSLRREVRIRPHESAAQGALRTRRLEKWAWVDSNYRPHAYQVSPRWRESRQEIV